MNIAIVGAGWAGMAAAVTAVRAGHGATVFEATRTAGGRARAVLDHDDDGAPLTLDNGQHILIGAYAECLRLMRAVGVEPGTALLRLPLALVFPDGSGLALPDLAPPWDAIAGILRARGWTARERLALLRAAAAWRLRGFRCSPETSVARLCAGLPARLLHEFIEPLCVSALNTPAQAASGAVFLRVLQDGLFSGRGGSNLLLPRVDLGALFPARAAQWLAERGHAVQWGRRVQAIAPMGAAAGTRWSVDGAQFDAVLLATPSTEAARLVRGCAQSPHAGALHAWADDAQALAFTAIATVYAQADAQAVARCLPLPMLALRQAADAPAQFVFDRGHLGGPAGLLAFVASAFEGERAALEAQVLRQAQVQLGLPAPRIVQTVVEKRATFACTPGLRRPAARIAPGLLACGDYVQGPYPATLEGAVRSGIEAARAVAAGSE
ncbi:hydroxysqualene dehydroxylase HpnE [Ramlibacter sp. H39-3-26]|uniref:hydroxysqualene dehydroxylase HpnE n=1 Tax=Curvibacter soli TaxID=3031331 RepID=UPI0023DC1F25|nr:hydroxysqualene dehydroxylase HpnE [Ramlibacter sp. H39-3-26]MDF1484032.1 hydroxysqualene dehydroxylase HpnE [Ramlibacter sp. H39-3-26]